MQPTTRYPLAGVRILSLAEQYPGPYATLLLSDLGADVIQVERPAGGDPARRFPGLYDALNRGKRSVALDLKDPDAARACNILASHSDAVLEGFRPGVMARLGLAPDDLLAAKPSLVVVSITGFGQTGPYKMRPGHDLAYQALAGTLTASEGSGSAPASPALTFADLTAGLFAAIATLTGVVQARTSGVGGRYDVSMFDSLVSLLTVPLAARLNTPSAPEPGGDPAYGVFATSDGRWLALAVAFEDEYWKRIATATGCGDISHMTHAERIEDHHQVKVRIAAAVASQTLSHWEEILDELDVPFGAVNDISSLLRDPHFQSRGLLQPVPDGRDGAATHYVRQPLRVDDTAPGPRSPAPKLGQDTVDVLKNANLGTTFITSLLERGAALAAAKPSPQES